MQWTEKHRPKKLEGVKGQDEAIEKIKQFLKEFQEDKTARNAILIGGGPGVGKTTIAHVLAKEMNKELFELNASDIRNKAKLREVLKPAIEQKPLVKQDKVILIDEVDGISSVDRGGLTELVSLINKSTYMVIITANDVWKKSLRDLRRKTRMVELKDIPNHVIKSLLIDILRKENKFLKIEILDQIAKNSQGDLRAAINDLQIVAHLDKPEEIVIDQRDKEKTIFKILREVFQEKATNDVLKSFEKTGIPLDEIILWIEENIPNIYSGKELVNAYNRLSKVDLFKGRIYKQQYWRFLVYENILLSYGISSAKEIERNDFIRYKKPERILKIWLNNQRTAKKKTIAEKYAKTVHVGTKRIMSEWGEVKNILKNPEVQKELKLTQEEVEYIR